MNSQSLGRLELLAWINDFTQCDYPKIEILCDGIAYCQVGKIYFLTTIFKIIDAMHPSTINLSKLNFNAKYKEDFQKNLKILDEAFHKAGIEKIVPIEKLSQCKFQDNMTFLQWLYNYSCKAGPIVTKSYRGYERRLNAMRKQKYNKSQTMNAYLLPNNAFMKFNPQQQLNDERQNQMMQQQQQLDELQNFSNQFENRESESTLNNNPNQKMDQRLQYLIDYTKSLEIDCKQKMEYNWKLLYAIDDMLYQRNTLFKILQEIEQVSAQQQESELRDAIINILYYVPEDFQKAEQQQIQIKTTSDLQKFHSNNDIQQQQTKKAQINLKSDQNIMQQQGSVKQETKEKQQLNAELPKYMQQQKYFGL